MSALVTVEGSDGAGKTTQLGFIAEWMRSNGIDFVQTREPGGTLLGEQLRELLLHGTGKADEQKPGFRPSREGDPGAGSCNARRPDIAHETELLLMFAARQQHLHELVLPSLQAGRWVLCDRFTDASYAYQGAGRGIDPGRIAILEEWVQGELRPDLTLVLDVEVEVGVARSAERMREPELAGVRASSSDRFERQNLEFKKAVRQCYLARADAEPDRVKLINAGVGIEEVQAQIATCLEQFLSSFRQSDCG